ncbi:MAG: acetyl-CoA hydrolase/transferase family protein [Candidatus Binatia bacterium]
MNSLYDEKKRTAAEAASLMRPRDQLAVPLGPGQPGAFLEALGGCDFEQLSLFGALLLAPYSVLFKPGVKVLSGFYGPVERVLRAQGMDVEFIPADFRRFAPAMRKLAPRVMATAAAPPDAQGRMSLSLHAGASVDELHRAGADPNRLLIVEVNKNLPRTLGVEPDHTHSLSVEEADVIIESDAALPTLPEMAPSEVEHAIAEQIRPYVKEGMTLQTGIGGIPSTVVEILAASGGGDYGIHSEMFTTGLMKLHEAGKITNRKGIYDGFSVATFALGTEELHHWLHEQPDVRFLPVHLVNDPAVIARNRRMLSINGALAVDLYGQLAADTIDGRQFSGIGGAEDFVCGASFSEGGHSIVCLPSTANVGGKTISRIVAEFGAGSIVTTPRHQVDVVVTEYGAAELAGLTVRERADALARIAHPDFRDALRDRRIGRA